MPSAGPVSVATSTPHIDTRSGKSQRPSAPNAGASASRRWISTLGTNYSAVSADFPNARPTRPAPPGGSRIRHPRGVPRALGPYVKQTFAWLLVIAGFVSAVVAFFIDAERPAANPWLLFIVGVGLAVVGIILIVLDRRAVMTAVAARITRQRLPD